MTATKQHQLLAVEPTRQAAADKQLAECTNTFAKKDTLFTGKNRVLRMFVRNPEKEVEITALEAKDAINTSVQNTVAGNLNYMAGVVGSWLDVVFVKELTNQIAKANVVIDGKIIIEGAPATFLLGLENKLGKLRDLYAALPTLAPGIDWSPAEDKGAHIFKSPTTVTIKTENVVEMVRQQQSSDKHPDTFKEQTRVNNIGQYQTTDYSAMISVAEKARIIARLDRLLIAVKDARCQANEAEAVEKRCATSIFAYLHGDLHDEQRVREATQS